MNLDNLEDLVVNGLLKEQGIEYINAPNTFNTGKQDTKQGLKQTDPICGD